MRIRTSNTNGYLGSEPSFCCLPRSWIATNAHPRQHTRQRTATAHTPQAGPPQFSRTHINFQRVPTVDTSNPFIARDIPTPDESFVVIHFSDPVKDKVDFPYLLNMIHNSFMSRPNTIVVPGGKMGFAMEVIITPLMHEMVAKKKRAK